MPRAGIPLISFALLVVAEPLLLPGAGLASRVASTLSPHEEAVQEAIRQSGKLKFLAFDATMVTRSLARQCAGCRGYVASPPVTGPPGCRGWAVVSFVYRADVPRPRDRSLSSFRNSTRRTAPPTSSRGPAHVAHRGPDSSGTDDILGTARPDPHLQRELANCSRQEETQRSMAAAREDMQKATNALAADLAAARKFMLQTAQLGWLNHELNVENANGLRKVSTASQELAANSARLADTLRQLSDNLASQLKQLAERLENLQNKINGIR
jgi:hypothetical protein